jgi:putative SOS response-associated peptidase YedK
MFTTCSPLTTIPNAVTAPIHDRMPILLPETKVESLLALLMVYPPDTMRACAVSTRVNSPAYDPAGFITPTA